MAGKSKVSDASHSPRIHVRCIASARFKMGFQLSVMVYAAFANSLRSVCSVCCTEGGGGEFRGTRLLKLQINCSDDHLNTQTSDPWKMGFCSSALTAPPIDSPVASGNSSADNALEGKRTIDQNKDKHGFYYYPLRKANAGSVPFCTTNTQSPNPYRLGFFCPLPQ